MNLDTINKLKELSHELPLSNEQQQLFQKLIEQVATSQKGDQLKLDELEKEKNHLSRELRHTRASLNQLDELKHDFLSICAHDLKSPTGTILSFVEILINEWKSLPPRDIDTILSRISRSGNHMMNLISDLLDMVQIESGKIQINPIPMLLSHLCNEVLAGMEARFEQKEIKSSFTHEGGELRINMDPQKGTQILNNLLSNALKFTPRGGQVELILKGEDKKMKLEIRDNGQGIPEEELDQLFKQFSKTSTKATEGEAGSGLGLSIVQQLVELHNGKIEVRSKKEVGTSFLLTFPVAENPTLMKLFSGKK